MMQTEDALRIFHGAVAIITGGASGIGQALGEELATRGCEVVLADRQLELAQKVAAAIQATGGKASAVELNVVDCDAVEKLVKETRQRTGRLDYMFNNAGFLIASHFLQCTIEEWHHLLDVNLRGVMYGARAAYEVMLEQGFGHIVNSASMAGLVPGPETIAYATSKHAVVGFSTGLRLEAASHGIRVSAFCPGFIRTPILKDGGEYGRIGTDLSEEEQQQIAKMYERFRPMDPKEFARRGLNQVVKNKMLIVLPSHYKVMWWIYRLSPSLSVFLGQNLFTRSSE